MRFNKRHILGLILLLAVIVLFLPIHVRFSFETTAKFYPVREWILARGETEGFWSQLYNYETDGLSDYFNYRFERGDIAEIQMSPQVKTNQFIEANDTVAYINSFFIENEITKLKNTIQVEKATLAVEATGEKQALIDQAQKKYDYSLEMIVQAKRNHDRQKKLFDTNVIPAAEYELAENALKLAEINADVALNELNSLRTGQKSTILQLVEERIKSYEEEIKRLEKQKKLYTIISPISGTVRYDELTFGIKVNDNSRMVLKIPVLYQNSQYLNQISSVEFTTPGDVVKLPVEFIGFEENVSMIQFQQFVIAKAITNEKSDQIFPGMYVKCRIYCDKITLFQYVKRKIQLAL